jgi:cysteine-S-conjugate beta-lyase
VADGPAGGDPFGLDDLDVADLKARPGTKWARASGRLAAWIADMDFPIAPAIRDRLIAVARTDVGYPDWPAIGRSSLPDRFADRMASRFGWTPAVDRLHELGDVMQGVSVAIHHLTRPGDAIVLHMPAYHPFLETIAAAGRRIVPVPAELVGGAWRFDHDELAARLRDGGPDAARLLLLCHPHNPIGHVFTRAELEQLAEIVIRHDLAVVSDEIHAELVHPPHGHVPFAALGDEVAARTVTITSASKAFNLAGLRWAILHAGHDGLHAALDALTPHYFGAPNLMGVAATEAAWSDGDEWQRAVATRLDANRTVLAALLAEHLPGVGYAMPEATYFAWLDFRALGHGDDPAATLRERGVELSSGPRFGPQGIGFARLNFATSAGVLDRIVRAMAGLPGDGDLGAEAGASGER